MLLLVTKNALQGLRLWQTFPWLITHPFGSQGYAFVVSPLLPKITCWPLAQENLIRRLVGFALLTKIELLVVVVVKGLCFGAFRQCGTLY